MSIIYYSANVCENILIRGSNAMILLVILTIIIIIVCVA